MNRKVLFLVALVVGCNSEVPQNSVSEIIRAHVSSKLVREYFTNEELTARSGEYFILPLMNYHKKALEKLGNPGEKLVICVSELRGVKDILINRYNLQVRIDKTFEWVEDGINEGVIECIKSTLGISRVRVKDDSSLQNRSIDPREFLIPLIPVPKDKKEQDSEHRGITAAVCSFCF